MKPVSKASRDQLLTKLGIVRRPSRELLYRCALCRDTGWHVIDRTGRTTVERCRGAGGDGCPHDEWWAQRRAEKAQRKQTRKRGEYQ